MMDTDKKNQWPPREGTSQAARHLPALDPEDFPVDGRSIGQLLEFTRDYARQLKYFDADDHEHGDWDKFLPDDLSLGEVERFIAAPESITDETTLQQLTRPHRVLFLTFLKLFAQAQERMNAFSRRHLEFYYRQVLRQTLKPGEPDQIHVLLTPADGEENVALPVGTRLAAGKDSQGVERYYRTDRELLVNRARVQDIRTLFVDYRSETESDGDALVKEIWQIQDYGGLARAISFALGDPEPNDPLPEQRNFYELTLEKDETYIREKLFLEEDNFKQVSYVLHNEGRFREYLPEEAQSVEAQLNAVCRILSQAMRRKRGWRSSISRSRAWQNLYAARDLTRLLADKRAADAANAHWRTFGGVNPRAGGDRTEATAIGFAVSSPLLVLGEGERHITLTLGFEEGDDRDPILKALSANASPFRFVLSSGEKTLEFEGKSTIVSQYPAIRWVPLKLRFELVLNKQMPPISPPITPDDIGGPWPVLQVLLADSVSEDGRPLTKQYDVFRSLVLEKVHLKVEVTGITGLTLQNDDGVLDPKRSFEPFGMTPMVGSRLYIGHPEMGPKALDSLGFHIEWMGGPEDLKEHYAQYTKLQPAPAPDFTARVMQFDRGVGETLHERAGLFKKRKTTDNKEVQDATQSHEISITGKPVFPASEGPDGEGDLLSWNRYLLWELNAPDFQHGAYSSVAAANEYKVNAPYTPRIKSLSLAYSASAERELSTPGNESGTLRLFHVHPFGHAELTPANRETAARLLPRYDNQGELYIGLADVRPPQSLSLLFQLADGSANPDPELEPARVRWSYLSGNSWKSLEQGDLNFDGTRGLINSGIIKFNLPAAEPNTLLPASQYWIRAAVERNAGGVADTVAIAAQAVSATREDAARQYAGRGLAGDAITGLAVPHPGIETVRQPFPAFGGREPERPSDFHTRVSERLRHKNRALTVWDYERLILECFPQVYKAKCIPAVAAEAPGAAGGVRIVVIPDIRNNTLSDPFAPKAPASLLADITAFLRERMPAVAVLNVRNADFVPVKLRFSVRFKPSAVSDEGYYQRRLNDEINRFLSPWAYDEQADIVFGQRIYANDIVNFIDGREYVDYVAQIKLFKWKDERWSEVFEVKEGNGGYFVTTDRRDEVLVAARRHEIGNTADYEDEIFAGIGYMRIELDFVVA